MRPFFMRRPRDGARGCLPKNFFQYFFDVPYSDTLPRRGALCKFESANAPGGGIQKKSGMQVLLSYFLSSHAFGCVFCSS
jgi:hypothetical protein